MSGWSKAKSALDTASGVSGWWLHDLRRTLATGLQRFGVRLEVTEAVLNHLSGSRGWRSRNMSKARLGRGETRSTRRMVCAPSRRSGRQADCCKGVAIQPSALRRDVAELSSWRTPPSPPRASPRSRASASGPFCRQLFGNLRVFSGHLVGTFALSRRKQGFESPRERQ